MTRSPSKPCALLRASAAGMALIALASASHAQQTSTWRYQYDPQGNLTQATDPLGRVTTYRYDALHRRTKVFDAANGVTHYGYNGQDRLVSVTDARALVTTYGIDGLGNLTQITSPDTGTTVMSYDDAGNLTSSTDAKGQTTRYRYDILSRLAHIAYADGSTVDYSYDQGANAIGHLTQITDASGSIAFSYDQRGRVISELRTIGDQTYLTAYRYDVAGRLAGLTYPSGRSIDYQRDGAGRINQISTTKGGATQVLVADVVYQPFGPPQMVTYGNGRTHMRSYDLDGRVASYTLKDQVQVLHYDAASRLTAIDDAGNAANRIVYDYDALNRVTSALKAAGSIGYAYDAVGNRTSKTLGAAVTTYAYGATSNRQTQITGNPTTAIGMDGNGSIVNNASNQFSYDARGRMVTATTAIGLVQYRINGLGQRVQKITPTASTVFHYDRSGKLIAESTGQDTIEYVYLHDMPIAVLK